MTTGVLVFALALMLVIVIHEAGHFLVAKAFDFKATRFFLGFGPTLWSFHKGETEYGIKLFPVGGFVKIVGMNPYEEVPPEDQPRSYPNKPRWQRVLVLLAGSATHWVVAFVVLLGAAMTIGFPSDQVTNRVAAVTPQMATGEPAPAAGAGIRPDDRIVAVDGRRTQEWSEIRSFIRENPGEEVTFTIERNGERREVRARLGHAIVDRETNEVLDYASPDGSVRAPGPDEELVGFFGVEPIRIFETESLPTAMVSAGSITWDFTVGSVRGVREVFGMLFDGSLLRSLVEDGERDPGEGPVGLFGAGRIAGEAFERGLFLNLIFFIVGVTIFIGLMNLLPLPPLDGGHLAVVAYEAITGKAVDVRKLIPIAAAVISFFLVLFVLVLYLDLARPIEVPF